MNSFTFEREQVFGIATTLCKHRLYIAGLRKTILLARSEFKVTSLKLQRDADTPNSVRKLGLFLLDSGYLAMVRWG